MEHNSDRMGFALLAIVFISFLLLGVNSTKNTTSNFFKNFSSWVNDSRNSDSDTTKYTTYYAYAWSADGKSKFTTNNMLESTVPNLVSPTDTYSTSGNGTTNQRILVASLADQTKTLQNLGFKSGDKLTVTADVMVQVGSASAPGGTFGLQLGDSPWYAGFSTTNINGKSATYHQSGTVTITASDLTARVRGAEIRLDNVPSSTTVTVSNVRFQKASGETIAPYVGKYSGLKNAKQSTNYKDYEWAYNGNYPIKQVDD